MKDRCYNGKGLLCNHTGQTLPKPVFIQDFLATLFSSHFDV